MNRLEWNALDVASRAWALARPSEATSESVRESVADILEQVRLRGDIAVRALTSRFDAVDIADAKVGEAEFTAAERFIDDRLRAALSDAAERIERFHRAGALHPYSMETAPGITCERVVRPIRRVGLYVPAGTAPLPSTVLMLGLPARIAGCAEVVLCTPPRDDGSVEPAVLVAAERCGITRVFKVGGAQAIAAMAFGTASVPRCDKLFGPGNVWVTEAKRQVFLHGVAIDLPAGPSEVLVIADAEAPPAFVAADLLSQAEHGGDSQVILISDDAALLDAVEAAVETELRTLPRAAIARRALAHARLILVDTLDTALSISNAYSPEHLILAVREAHGWLHRVETAGSVFLGNWTPEALGDYCSGTNHVLPTGGAARAFSGLGVASFQNAISVQTATLSGIAGIGDCAIALADAEGLAAHAHAVSLRLCAVSA